MEIIKHTLKDVAVKPETPIIEVLNIINNAALSVALVLNENGKLLGIVTDGDIRRGMLKRIDLTQPVSQVMNANPKVAKLKDSRQTLITKLRSLRLRHMPVVDDNGIVVKLETIEHLLLEKFENWVVLMAGGLGTRLRPLTENCPKPLLKIGEKPVLEIVLENFAEQGFHKFFLSINYKGHLIQDYFGTGEKWNVKIQYLMENIRLGTAGALSLLPENPDLPILVMNADLMTKVNFQQLLNFHQEHEAAATICVREYKQVIPYGVVQIANENYQLLDIKEKPESNWFVNAGIYVLDPKVLSYLPKQSYYDMPNLLSDLISNGLSVMTFPLREYWLDIGKLEDLERAHQDYQTVFA